MQNSKPSHISRSRQSVSIQRFIIALVMIGAVMSLLLPSISSSAESGTKGSASDARDVRQPLTDWSNRLFRHRTDVRRGGIRYIDGVAATATPQNGCCGGEEGNNKPHILAGSYYTLRNNFSAKLLLNNKGPIPIEVQPALYSLSGERYDIPPLIVDATGHRFVDLHDWVALAGTQFREGSIQLFYRGKDLVLGTQIYLTDNIHSLSFDEKLTELGKGSSRLEGVWWLPSPRGEVRLVLSNTTNAALSVSVKVRAESPRKDANLTLNLTCHETKVLDVEADILDREHGAMSHFGAISVEHNGEPGAVLARAMAMELNDGYSLPVQFSNPAAAKSNNIQGAGLRISNAGGMPLSALVVMHNASQNEMTVNGRVPYTMTDGSTSELNLPQDQLRTGETKVIDITQLMNIQGVHRNEVASAGLELQHTGDLGFLITSALSVSDNGNQVFRVPLWDVAAQRSATGGYPWHIEGDSSTLVYIKNTTTQPRQFRMYVMFDGGSYLYPLATVAPSQTTTIDLRSLRDNQVPDMNGSTIPLAATRGQVQWSMTGGEDKVLIGRSEQVDLDKGISSNYACINCCGNSFYDAWLTPNQADGLEGDGIQFTAMQQDANCYGYIFAAHQVGASFSGNPSICDPNSSGLATAVAPGSSGIFGQWGADEWISWGNDQCQYSPVDVLRDALCDVYGLDVHFTTVFRC